MEVAIMQTNKLTAIQRDGRRARFFMPLELKTGRVPKEGYTAAHRAQVCADQSHMCFLIYQPCGAVVAWIGIKYPSMNAVTIGAVSSLSPLNAAWARR
jgi:hypothetical protein